MISVAFLEIHSFCMCCVRLLGFINSNLALLHGLVR